MNVPAPSPHVVVVLALEPVIGYDLVIPSQILGAARSPEGHPLYEVVVAGLTTASVATAGSGYAVVPAAGPEVLARADTVIVPGTQSPGPRLEGRLPDELVEPFASVRPGTRWVSICTGAFVLAAAGLLDGRRATTHWAYAEDLRRLHPGIDVDPEVLFVDEGDVLTSAGLSAGVDLCLHLLRTDHGAAEANRVARWCVVPPWRDGGQAQFIEHRAPTTAASGAATSTATTRAWAVTHLDQPLDVPALAQHASMSLRTFTRRFRAEVGETPAAWLTAQRLRRAQELLESTDLPVDRIARATGLGTSASLRQHLRSATGVSPSAYRRTFRGA